MSTETKKPKWSAVTFNQIEKRRKELGLAKSAMATAIGVTNSTFHNWQRGTTVPHPTQQEQIKAVLDTLVAPASGAASDLSSDGARITRLQTRVPNVAATPRSKRGAGNPERTSGSRESVAGGVHPMLNGFPTAHPFFPASGLSVPESDVSGIATITAAFISSQKESPSAGSVYEFVTGLRNALRPIQPAPATASVVVEELVAEPAV